MLIELAKLEDTGQGELTGNICNLGTVKVIKQGYNFILCFDYPEKPSDDLRIVEKVRHTQAVIELKKLAANDR
jgi:hypothetical protein